MTIANVDDFGREARAAIRRHWVINDAAGGAVAAFSLPAQEMLMAAQ